MAQHKQRLDITQRIFRDLLKLVPELSKGIKEGYKHYSLQTKNKKALLTLSNSRGKMYIELEKQELQKLRSLNHQKEKITHLTSIKSPYIRAEFNLKTKRIRTLCIHDERPSSQFAGHFMMAETALLLDNLFEKYMLEEFNHQGYKVAAKLEL